MCCFFFFRARAEKGIASELLLKYFIYVLKCSDHDFAGSSSHPLISAPSAISSAFSASQTTPLNMLPATLTQTISKSALNTPSVNASRATESHSSLLESSVSRGKDIEPCLL